MRSGRQIQGLPIVEFQVQSQTWLTDMVCLCSLEDCVAAILIDLAAFDSPYFVNSKTGFPPSSGCRQRLARDSLQV